MTAEQLHRPCPKCGGKDRFYKVPQPRSGARAYWKCRQCDYWEHEGGAPGLHIVKDGAPMEQMTPERYAQAHGATWDDFQRAGCTWLRYRWKGREYDAIRFPEGEGGRIRLFGADDKWVPERRGMAPVLWGFRRAVRIAQERDLPALLLVNGHSSVIPLQVAGIPAFTVPGGEGNIAGYLRRGLIEEVRDGWQGQIVVMLDGDHQGRKSAPDVVRAFEEAGIPAKSADPGDTLDAADALRLRGPDVMRAALVPAVSAPSYAAPDTAGTGGRWRLYSYDALADLPPVTWLIEGRIVAGGLNLIYGPSGTGKSFRTLDYVLRIAEAHPDRTVVYIAPEGGQGYRKRAYAWSLHNRRPVPTNIVWLLDAPRLDDPAQHAELASQLTPLRPICIVVDTLARCAVGLDENSARDMGVLINALDTLRKDLTATLKPGEVAPGVVLVHHTGKSGTGYRGSSALIGAADIAIELQPDGDVVTEECAKAKDDKPFEPTALTLKMVEEADSCVMVPASRRVDVSAPLSRNERKVLEVLNLEVFRHTGAKAAQVQESTGIAKMSLYRILSALKQREYLSQNDKGDPYFITGLGEAAVSSATARQYAEVSEVPSEYQEYHDTRAAPQKVVPTVPHPFRGGTVGTTETAPAPVSGYAPIPGFDDDEPAPQTYAAGLVERLRARERAAMDGGGHGEG